MLSGIRKATIIFNLHAGGGHARRPKDLEEARQILAKAGIEAELLPTDCPGAAGPLARRAAEDGAQLVVVCGGDGTLNEAINGMAGSQVPVALLPAGTANILAKELGILWNIPRAAAQLIRGTPVRIALGLMTPLAEPGARRYFLSVAGAGADGAVVHALDPAMKLKTGIIAYWMEGAKQLLRYSFPKFRVTDSTGTSDATLIIVGRTKRYGGPFSITTGADLFSNEFEVALFQTQSALRYVAYLPATWTGMLRKLRDVQFLKTKSVLCEPPANETVYAQVDGEGWHSLPAEFTIVPDALTLIVPENCAAYSRNGRGSAH
ncbi:MAG TPA: diacylglycerol kinase family protein [Candidatus Acidoferrales bacterium]|jgi:diacylglycerol kinase family enzyme|nr:diacylglycerol kinase family protein [Candidatus Acidoferrales bacterium]